MGTAHSPRTIVSGSETWGGKLRSAALTAFGFFENICKQPSTKCGATPREGLALSPRVNTAGQLRTPALRVETHLHFGVFPFLPCSPAAWPISGPTCHLLAGSLCQAHGGCTGDVLLLLLLLLFLFQARSSLCWPRPTLWLGHLPLCSIWGRGLQFLLEQ